MTYDRRSTLGVAHICGISCTDLVLEIVLRFPPTQGGPLPCSSPRFDALGARFETV